MTASNMTMNEIPAIPPAPPRLPTHWRVGWRSLRALMADPDDTARAIEFVYAVGAGHFERNFQRFAAEPSGKRLLLERPSLGCVLADRARLSATPSGSLGRAYLELMDEAGLDPLGLIEVQAGVMRHWQREYRAPKLDPAREWFRDRFILMHDLFHVMTGYGTDEMGEAALLAFSTAQLGGRANGFLTAATTLEAVRSLGISWLPYVYRAWLRGRRANWLAALPFEELLATPLPVLRHIGGLEEPAAAHRAGVLRGRWRDARSC